jgi:hypothetical protein
MSGKTEWSYRTEYEIELLTKKWKTSIMFLCLLASKSECLFRDKSTHTSSTSVSVLSYTLSLILILGIGIAEFHYRTELKA